MKYTLGTIAIDDSALTFDVVHTNKMDMSSTNQQFQQKTLECLSFHQNFTVQELGALLNANHAHRYARNRMTASTSTTHRDAYDLANQYDMTP